MEKKAQEAYNYLRQCILDENSALADAEAAEEILELEHRKVAASRQKREAAMLEFLMLTVNHFNGIIEASKKENEYDGSD